tara:strand:+ start:346 stop:504 length:159 start_codon:yes stop_codon:yes gene_type:complete
MLPISKSGLFHKALLENLCIKLSPGKRNFSFIKQDKFNRLGLKNSHSPTSFA